MSALLFRVSRQTSLTSSRSFGIRKVATVPLGEQYPGVPEARPEFVSSPKATVQTLPNGVKVATVFTKDPISNIGLFVNAGSRNETIDDVGASFFLKHMGFKSNTNRSSLRFIREIEGLGASFEGIAGRDSILFHSEVSTEKVPNLVEIMSGVLAPRLPEFEVRDERSTVSLQSEQLTSNPSKLLFELAHQEAYRNKTLGNPLYVPSHNLEALDEALLRRFVDKYYTADRVTLIATGGVEQKDLVMYAEAWFGSAKKGNSPSEPSKYFGGDLRVPKSGNTHLALAFQGLGLNASATDLMALGIIEQLLGRGKSLSRGPEYVGSNQSLLGKTTEKNGSWLKSASSFNFTYSDSGLFGISAEAERGNVPQLAQVVASDFKTVNNITEADFNRAKNHFLARLLSSGRSQTLQFVGKQISAGVNNPATPSEFASQLNSVTLADVKRVAKQILSSKPTLVVLGDVYNTPTIDEIKSMITGK